VSTTAARYQNLSLNPAKLSGQCGRLKCCLNYELDTYLQALKDIPQVQRALQTEKGDAFLQKTDIFKKKMWFAFRGDNNWVMLPTERVREIQDMNKRGEKPESLLPPVTEEERQPEVSAIVEGNLDRLDDKIKAGKRTKRKKKKPEASSDTNTHAGRPERSERPERQERPARPERTERPEQAPDATGTAAAASSRSDGRPRGAAAKPANRRHRPPRPSGEAGESRPARPEGGTPPTGGGSENRSERQGRGGRRGGGRRNGGGQDATPPSAV
jgi:hypothetical protein